MSSPVFNAFGGGQMPPQNGIFNMIQQFENFRKTFSGDPKQQVEDLMRSGKMSKEQFDQFNAMANQLAQFIK